MCATKPNDAPSPWLSPGALSVGLALGLVMAQAYAQDAEQYDRTLVVTDAGDAVYPPANGGGNAGPPLTLRTALTQAATLGGRTLVLFDRDMVITNFTGQLLVTTDVTIRGRGRQATVIDAHQAGRAFSIGTPSASNGVVPQVRLENMTVTNGLLNAEDSGSVMGAGLANFGSALTLSNVVLMHHRVVGAPNRAHFGAIDSAGPTLRLHHCVLAANEASGRGGALGCVGEVEIRHSLVQSNRAGWGGALYHGGGVVRVENSLFHANHASVDGGAIYAAARDSLTHLDNCTLSGNSTAGRGGALFHDLGGGTLRHVTLAFNRAAQGGGGLYQANPAPYPAAILENSLLAYNLPDNGAGVTSRILDIAGNVATDDTCNTATERLGDPLLGPLDDNGGNTLTHALHAGSIALDRADPFSSLPTDQRGQFRPRDGTGDLEARPDAGAFEAQAVPPPPRPAMILAGSQPDLGESVLDGPPVYAPISVRNVGPVPLTVESVSLSQGTDFRLQYGEPPLPVLPLTLGVGESWTFNLAFVPGSIGSFATTVTVVSNDAVAPSQSLTFKARAKLGIPVLDLVPGALDFGEVPLGQSVQQTLTLANLGDGRLELGSVEWTDHSDGALLLLEDDASGLTLAPGQQATIEIGFTPGARGRFQATLTVPSNDPDREGHPPTILVSGDGIVLSIMAADLEFKWTAGQGETAARGVTLDAEGHWVTVGSWQATSDVRDTTGFVHQPDLPWTHTLEQGPLGSGKDDSTDQFLAVTTDSIRQVIAVGVLSGVFTTDGYHQAIVLQKLSPEGELLWQQTYHEFAWNVARAVAVDQHDHILVAGNVHTSFAVNHQWVILKYSPEGELQPGFPIRVDFSGLSTPWDLAHGIAVHPDGRFVVVGQRAVADNSLDWHVRCYQPSGTLLWEDTHAEFGSGHEVAWDCAFTSTGSIVVAGTVWPGAAGDSIPPDGGALVIHYTPEGERAWTQFCPAVAGETGPVAAIAVDAFDQILVGSTLQDNLGLPQWHVVQLDPRDGSFQLGQTWHDTAGQVLHDLALRNGLMALSGSRGSGPEQSALVLAGPYRGEPALLLEPGDLPFGPVAIGQVVTASVVVSNRSDRPIEFMMSDDDDVLTVPFHLLEDPVAGTLIEPSAIREVRIAFRPVEVGPFQGTFQLRELGYENRVWSVSLSGSGNPLLVLGAEVMRHVEPGGPGANAGWGVTFNGDGALVTVGSVAAPDDPRKVSSGFVRRHGAAAWSHTLETGPVNPGIKDDSEDKIFGVTVDSQNHVIAVGQVSGSFPSDGYHQAMTIRKLSSTGELLWSRIYHNSPWNVARAVAVDAADNLYVAGHAFTSLSSYHQWAILKLSPDGNLASGYPIFHDQAGFEHPWDIPHGIAAWPDGGFVAVGQVLGGPDNLDWHLRHYWPDGQLAGVDTLDRARGLHDVARSVAVDSTGHFVVAGAFNRGGNNRDQADYDWLVIRYDRTTRQRLWTFTFESAPGRNEQAYAVTFDGLGRVLVAGTVQDQTGQIRGCLLQLAEEDGALLARQDAPSSGQYHALAVHNRDIAITGFTGSSPSQQAFAVVQRVPEPRITEVRFDADSVTVHWQFLMNQATLLFSPSWVAPVWAPLAQELEADSWTGPRPSEPQGLFRLLEP